MNPLDNKSTVPKSGKAQVLTAFNPIGGHKQPNSMQGAKLEWKNAQKKLKNSMISVARKIRKLMRIPC